MESFEWGAQFALGIADVDEQHQCLVAIINRFGEAVTENVLDEKFVSDILEELAEYARTHFSCEEKLMHGHKVDPRHVVPHVVEHHDFFVDVANFTNSITPGPQDGYRSLFEYLVHWLAYHILGTDRDMALQIADIVGGNDPAEAYDKEKRAVSRSTEPLLTALNGLFALVSERNKALSELNQTLEMRVAEQTRDLLKANEALEQISITDPLTQLPNRRFAMRQMRLLWDEALMTQQPLACLMIDADGFKAINDTYGHDAGDHVLLELAIELQDSVRSDDIVCRLGGDEFFVICPNTDLDGAMNVAGQIQEKVAALKVSAGDGYWAGSVSIGVAVNRAEMKDIEALIKAADEGVYIAKKDGRNCVRTR